MWSAACQGWQPGSFLVAREGRLSSFTGSQSEEPGQVSILLSVVKKRGDYENLHPIFSLFGGAWLCLASFLPAFGSSMEARGCL